jgi:hypothetical protein
MNQSQLRIPIVDCNPIYPRSHIATLIDRVRSLEPDVDPEEFLCVAFGVSKLDDLVDACGLLERYDYHPRVTSNELREIAKRITPLLPVRKETLFESISDRALKLVRNTLDTCPMIVEDLKDYISKKDISILNSLLDVGEKVSAEIRAPILVPNEARKSPKLDQSMLALAETAQYPFGEGEDDLTIRQSQLHRIAYFYLLTLYGVDSAMLTVADAINPLTQCSCNDVDCGSSSAGFSDIGGSSYLVEASMDHLLKAIAVSREHNRNHTCESCGGPASEAKMLGTCLTLCHGLMMQDQKRLNGELIRTLLEVVEKGEDVLQPIQRAYLGVGRMAHSMLYCKDVEVVPSDHMDTMQLVKETINAYDGGRPARAHVWMFDAYNFSLLEGLLIDDGLEFMMIFLVAPYSAGSFYELSKIIISFADQVDELRPQLERKGINLLQHPLGNPLGFLMGGITSFAHSSKFAPHLADDLLSIVTSDKRAQESPVANILAGLGNRRAVQMCKELSDIGDKKDTDYWGRVLKAIVDNETPDVTLKNYNDSRSFISIVENLETALGHTQNMTDLVEVIDRSQFEKIRADVVAAFDIGNVKAYSGVFGVEVEFGDVSDAVRMTTFALYEINTPPGKIISLEERRSWCQKVLDALDFATVD